MKMIGWYAIELYSIRRTGVHTRTWSYSHKLSRTLLSTGVLRSYMTPITRLSLLGLLCYIHYYKIINIYIFLFSLHHASQTPPSPRIQATKFSICVAERTHAPKNMWPLNMQSHKKKVLEPSHSHSSVLIWKKETPSDAPRERRQLSLKSKSCRQKTYRYMYMYIIYIYI